MGVLLYKGAMYPSEAVDTNEAKQGTMLRRSSAAQSKRCCLAHTPPYDANRYELAHNKRLNKLV